MSAFIPINVKKINKNLFKLLDDRWMLVSAGNRDKFNMMTASWGAYGILWNKPVAIIFVRHNRYTYEFIENNDLFSLSFFPKKYKDALKLCGIKSGRDHDKIKETGLTPLFSDNGNIYYEESDLVFLCKKIYSVDMDKNIPSEIIKKHYPDKIFHRMFIGEIKSCLIKRDEEII